MKRYTYEAAVDTENTLAAVIDFQETYPTIAATATIISTELVDADTRPNHYTFFYVVTFDFDGELDLTDEANELIQECDA